MNNSLNWHYSDIEWLEQVHKFLLEIARASLSDKPKLPDNIHERAMPLAKEAKEIRKRIDNQGLLQQNSLASNNFYLQDEEGEWVEQVRQHLLELSRVSLSADLPRLPPSMGQTALSLAHTAQEIKNTVRQKS